MKNRLEDTEVCYIHTELTIWGSRRLRDLVGAIEASHAVVFWESETEDLCSLSVRCEPECEDTGRPFPSDVEVAELVTLLEGLPPAAKALLAEAQGIELSAGWISGAGGREESATWPPQPLARVAAVGASLQAVVYPAGDQVWTDERLQRLRPSK